MRWIFLLFLEVGKVINISNLRLEDKVKPSVDSKENFKPSQTVQDRRRGRVVNTIEQIQNISSERNGRLFEISDILNIVNDRNTVQQAAYMSGV